MNLSILTPHDLLRKLTERPLHPWEDGYLAHFSTYWDGLVTDPRFLMIPLDDHMVHRGDGIFEAFRSINNKIYLLGAHLDRLRLSAKAVDMPMPWNDVEIRGIIESLASITKESHLMFRLFVSRGAGGFTTNPYECPRPHLTIVACRFKPYAAAKYQTGAVIGRSRYTQKPEPFAGIKSCNYLPNVLMKKEAVDRKLDFVVAYTEQDLLTESSTENIFLLNDKQELLHPRFGSILRGTTLCRVLELAQTQLQMTVRETDITEEMLLNAKEVFMAGTTLDILPVSHYEQQTYVLGEVGQNLRRLLAEDQDR